jgi:beta-glucosidase
MVEAMVATGKPVVVVLNNGAPFALPWIHDHAKAVVESWYLGQSYGTALARMLFGDVNPSGKLNVSFPVSVGQTPDYYNHAVLTGPILYDPAKTEFPVPFGKPNVLWAFGHGLSYTTFQYADLKFSQPAIQLAIGTATVSAKITNTGTRAGTEVAQMYVHQDATSLNRPVEELKGFVRVTLAPGETKTVTFPIGFEQVKFWKDGAWRMEPGELKVWIGGASDDLKLEGTLGLK